MDFRRSERQRVEVRSWSTPNISKLHSLTLVATLPDSITRRSYERERVDGRPAVETPPLFSLGLELARGLDRVAKNYNPA